MTAKAIEEFVRTRVGVEAYVEPRTLQQPLSVVLVATDGEWRRFSIPDEGVLRARQAPAATRLRGRPGGLSPADEGIPAGRRGSRVTFAR